MFAITSCKGFHITFKNGITLSTQFGSGNYCSNFDMELFNIPPGLERLESKLECGNAEIAIWDKDHVWRTNQAYKELFNEYKSDEVIKGKSNK